MSLTLLYIVIARSVSDVAISKRDSFASLGMTHGRLFMGQDTRKEKDIQSVTTFENIMTLSGYYFMPEQVRQIIDGYEGTFTKTNTRLSRNIRGFVEAIE
jgi:hypothetical protein